MTMGSPSAVWNEPCTPPTATPSEREQFCQKSSSEQYLRRAGQCVSVGDYRIELGCRVSNWHGVSRLRDSAGGAQLAHSKPRSSSETLPCFVTMAPAATSIFCWSMCGPKTFQLLRSGPPAVAQHILTHGIDRTRAHQLHAAGAHFSRADASTGTARASCAARRKRAAAGPPTHRRCSSEPVIDGPGTKERQERPHQRQLPHRDRDDELACDLACVPCMRRARARKFRSCTFVIITSWSRHIFSVRRVLFRGFSRHNFAENGPRT